MAGVVTELRLLVAIWLLSWAIDWTPPGHPALRPLRDAAMALRA